LISAYITELRRAGEPVAVLAVDPSSPVSSGAVLGDLTRVNAHAADPQVYIRSVSSRGQRGGLASSIPAFIDALDAAGWRTIVLETVGTGQTDADALAFVDVGVLLSAPGMGDEVQAIKAGLQEVADILVVNKSDLPGADRTAQHLTNMLQLRRTETPLPPVIRTSSVNGHGVAELAACIRSIGRTPDGSTEVRRTADRLRRAVLLAAEAEFMRRLATLDVSELDRLCAQIQRNERSLPSVVDAVLDRLGRGTYRTHQRTECASCDRARDHGATTEGEDTDV